MKKFITFISFIAIFGLGIFVGQNEQVLKDLYVNSGFTLPTFEFNQENKTLKKVVINEAVHTLLYLPLYHAQQKDYFKDEGLNVEIVTGGTATNSFAAMISGEADFSQADPMYVPISREKGAQTKVVAQVVGRIAVWGSTLSPDIKIMDTATLKGKSIATHPRPMTAYTYTLKVINDAGLIPDKDVTIIQSKPGTELIPFLDKKADYVMTVEPSTSIAETKGAHVVLSYPEILGDQVFSALMTSDKYIAANKDTVMAVIRAYQKSLTDIKTHPDAAINTAIKYFPQMEKPVIEAAVNRIVREKVIPESVLITEESWNKAIAERVRVGDLKSNSPLGDNVAIDLIKNSVPQ